MRKVNFNIAITLAIVLMPILFCSSGQQQRIPFCGFSVKDGGYYANVTEAYINKQFEYIQKEAKVGDETGIADVVESIKKVIGINVPFVTYISKGEDNAYATIANGGKRILVIDHMFMHTVNKESGTEWAAISIIAHEIGHHVAGFNRRATQHEAEFDADYWSGYVLQKLGSSEEAATKCIMRYGTEIDTKSHPNKYSRRDAIKKGWRDASRGHLDKDRCQSYY